jgi:peptidoglycan hydrolase-like protein with peptidoglycan-binding domain
MLQSRRLGSNAQLRSGSENRPALKSGASGDGVAILQDLLVDLGFALPKTMSRRTADGVFGQETQTAIKQFQLGEGLTSDGVAGAMTLAALDARVVANARLEERPANSSGRLGAW